MILYGDIDEHLDIVREPLAGDELEIGDAGRARTPGLGGNLCDQPVAVRIFFHKVEIVVVAIRLERVTRHVGDYPEPLLREGFGDRGGYSGGQLRKP